MRTDNLQKQYPHLARVFDLYLQCRSTQLFHMEVSKNKGKQTEARVVRWVTGFHALPEPGGMLDQPVWTMEMFEIFRTGENRQAMKDLSK